MPNVLEKVIDIFVAVLIMFIIPVCYFNIKKDTVTQVNVDKETAAFVETVSTQGYVTKDMYEKYLRDLETTGKLYDVRLIHESNAFEPEYILRSEGEVINEDEGLWAGINEYYEETVSTNKPDINDPVDNSGLHMNTETNESILLGAVRTPASASHVHTDGCYAGHRHTDSCKVQCGDMTKGVLVCRGNMDDSYLNDRVIKERVVICQSCGKQIACVVLYDYSADNGHYTATNGQSDLIMASYYTYSNDGSPQSKMVSLSRYNYYYYDVGGGFWNNDNRYLVQNPLWNATVNQFTVFDSFTNPYTWSYRPVMGTFYGMSMIAYSGYALGIPAEDTDFIIPLIGAFSGCPYCGAGERYNCGQVQDDTLICSQIVTGIAPTNPVQVVYTEDPLITTAIATYLDGSTQIVLCNTTFSTANVVKDQTATLTYTTTVAGNTISKSTTIIVTVIPKTKTCSKGHTYNLHNDGVDTGCPFCKQWLQSLSIMIPSSGKLTMYRNSSLEMEGVGLKATYLDGHTEIVYNGYVDNLDEDYIGKQTVTIGYKGLTTTLQVEILRNRKLCDVCGRYYNLYMDDTDPGCPYCRARVPVFSGNIMTYCTGTYEDEIITELYEGKGTYYFRRGDNIIVKVKSKSNNLDLINRGSLFGLQIRVVRADTIKDEVMHK